LKGFGSNDTVFALRYWTTERAGSGDGRFTTPDFSSWENFEARIKAKAARKVRREAKKW
jgi:hypothetical protein